MNVCFSYCSGSGFVFWCYAPIVCTRCYQWVRNEEPKWKSKGNFYMAKSIQFKSIHGQYVINMWLLGSWFQPWLGHFVDWHWSGVSVGLNVSFKGMVCRKSGHCQFPCPSSGFAHAIWANTLWCHFLYPKQMWLLSYKTSGYYFCLLNMIIKIKICQQSQLQEVRGGLGFWY